MPDSDDYRKYLDEKFSHANDNMNLNFKAVDIQFNDVNGRLDIIEHKVNVFSSHSTDCPQIPKIQKINDDLSAYKESQADLNWIQKHPKLAITYCAGAVFVLAFSYLGLNKMIPSKGESVNRTLIETKFKELEDKNDVIEKKLEKQNAYYETALSNLNNKNIKKPQK